jgi:hypothetical protein
MPPAPRPAAIKGSARLRVVATPKIHFVAAPILLERIIGGALWAGFTLGRPWKKGVADV